MGVLEGIVIVALVLAGIYVGYHAWQESLDTTTAHSVEAKATSHDGHPASTKPFYHHAHLQHAISLAIQL